MSKKCGKPPFPDSPGEVPAVVAKIEQLDQVLRDNGFVMGAIYVARTDGSEQGFMLAEADIMAQTDLLSAMEATIEYTKEMLAPKTPVTRTIQ